MIAGLEISCTAGHRTDPPNAARDGSPEGIAPTAPGVLPIGELEEYLTTAESSYRSGDPYERAAVAGEVAAGGTAAVMLRGLVVCGEGDDQLGRGSPTAHPTPSAHQPRT